MGRASRKTRSWPFAECLRPWRSSSVAAIQSCSKRRRRPFLDSRSARACASLFHPNCSSRPSMLSPVADTEHLRVLVVDDDQMMLRTLADILRHRGYDATTAATGGAALQQVAAGARPAVALIDLMLPDMAGMEVVRALRQISRNTEVVVLTGHASLATAVTALREQSYDYLVKPVAPDYLLQTIGKAGERWRRRMADEKFEALLEAAPDAMVIVDESGSIVLVNGQTEALFGYSREEVLGQPIEVLVPEGLRESQVRHRSIYASHPKR